MFGGGLVCKCRICQSTVEIQEHENENQNDIPGKNRTGGVQQDKISSEMVGYEGKMVVE